MGRYKLFFILLIICIVILLSAGSTLYFALRYELPEDLFQQLFAFTTDGMTDVSLAIVLAGCAILCLIAMVVLLAMKKQATATGDEPDPHSSDAGTLEAIIQSRTESLNNALDSLDDAQIMADIGNFRWDLDTNKFVSSKNMHRLLKYDLETDVNFELVQNTIFHPSDSDIVSQWISSGIKNRSVDLGSIEHRLICLDGEIIWVRSRVKIDYEGDRAKQVIGSIQNITAIRDAELSEQMRKDKIILYQETLASFIRHPLFLKMQYDELIDDLTKIVSETLDVSRVSVWSYEKHDSGAVIDLVNLWNSQTRQHTHDMVLSEADFPSYFSALNEIRVLKYDDVYSEPEVAEFTGSYFPENNITSMMDVPFYQSGELAGVICLEHTAAPRHWTLEEQSFLLSIAEVVTIFYESKRRVEVEAALKHTEKVEALGQLTGGIAHDFNNMLGVIMGYSELLVSTLAPESEGYGFAKQIQAASNRGARLTSNLLSFSRKKPLDQREIDLVKFLTAQRELIQKTLTVAVDINFMLPSAIWPAYIDQSNLEHALINLCINAQHAMEHMSNPQLVLHLRNETLSDSDSELLNVTSGDYVVLSIKDNGCGMTKEQVNKIFDPYFSTKGDKGTGLGLSQVYSFIQEEKGAITVNSEVGVGTTFNMYFPRFKSEEEQVQPNDDLIADLNQYRGFEKIVVVDDEMAICGMASEILTKFGYKTETFTSAVSAIEYLKNYDADMVLTDVLMPQMDGFEFCSIINQEYPHVKVQLMSGFADTNNTNLVDEDTLNALLPKPFSPIDLLKAVRELLDS